MTEVSDWQSMSVFRKFLKDHDIHEADREKAFENNVKTILDEFDIFESNKSMKKLLERGDTTVNGNQVGHPGTPERADVVERD